MGFFNWIRVEATGYAGGIWLMWNEKDCTVTYISSNEQILHCQIRDKHSSKTFFGSFVYGETNRRKRQTLWQSIKTIAKATEEARILLGDFNAYRAPRDKRGGAKPHITSMSDFNECITDSGLLELEDTGNKFTWERGEIQEKLDWVFGNIAWDIKFPTSRIYYDLKYKSDHKVIVLSLYSQEKQTTSTTAVPLPSRLGSREWF
ncbi:uncharacterized protein LOC114752964 [Neltuma alba]|uniref:uncharacterized protein LOC114752964 n=1 Tax=Neltuma alba TaxID=207710 RepID=UPI0010A3B9EA|nr:uncharacterized protein LOC114752964 [Prosopis alba]